MKRLLLMAMASLLLIIGTACAGPEEEGVAAYSRHWVRKNDGLRLDAYALV